MDLLEDYLKREQIHLQTIHMLQQKMAEVQLTVSIQQQQIIELSRHTGNLEKQLFQLKATAMLNSPTSMIPPPTETGDKEKTKKTREESSPSWTEIVEGKRGRRGPSPPPPMVPAAVPVPVLPSAIPAAGAPVPVQSVPVQIPGPVHMSTAPIPVQVAKGKPAPAPVPTPVSQKKKEEKKKPPVPHHTAENLAGGQQQQTSRKSSLKASLSQLPTAEEKLKCLLKIPIDTSDPAYVKDIKSATIFLPLSGKARQHPQVAIAEAIQAWSGHKVLLISILTPNIAEIFFDARLEDKILKLPRGVRKIENMVTTRDIPRRMRACLQAHFSGLREATLRGFPAHRQLEILRGAQNLIPKQLEKLEFWKLKNLSITRAIRALDPGVVQEAQEEEAV